MALHVLRKKDTKQMVAMWAPPGEGEGDLIPEVGENEEWVVLQNMTHDSAVQLAKAQAEAKGAKKGEFGEVRIYDDRLEADAPTPPRTMADEIKAHRLMNGGALNAPITLDELDLVERKVNPRFWER